MKAPKYTYPLQATLLATVPPAIFVLMGLLLLPHWAKTLWDVLVQYLHGNQPSVEEIRFICAAWIPLFVGLTLLAMYTEIEVQEEGLKARVFIFKWVFIPWRDVLDIRLPNLPGYQNPQLWCFIQVRKLTIFHRILGMAYLIGPQPVLIINKHLKGYDELLSTLSNRLTLYKQNPPLPPLSG